MPRFGAVKPTRIEMRSRSIYYHIVFVMLGIGATIFPFNSTWRFAPETASLTVEGTSTVHDWTCEAGSFVAAATAKTDAASAAFQALQSVTFSMPSDALECKNRTMNRKTRNALLSDEHPEVHYQMQKSDVVSSSDDRVELSVSGTLSVAGQDRTVEMTVTATDQDDGSVLVNGSLPLKMTDFGIKPPTALLGTLKTGDEITVHFEVTASQESGA